MPNGGAIGQPVAPFFPGFVFEPRFWAGRPILPNPQARGRKVQLLHHSRMDHSAGFGKAGFEKKKGGANERAAAERV